MFEVFDQKIVFIKFYYLFVDNFTENHYLCELLENDGSIFISNPKCDDAAARPRQGEVVD